MAQPAASPVERYRALLEVSEAIASHRTLEELFRDLAERLHLLLNFHSLGVVLHDPARNVMRLHILETSLPALRGPGMEFPMEESPSAWAWQSQEALVIHDTETETRVANTIRLLTEQGIRSMCSLPLTTAQRRLGALNLGSSELGAYDAADLDFARLVAAQVAVAVDNALRDQEAQALQHQLARDRDRLQLVLDLNNRVVSNLDLRQLFQTISSDVRRVMQCEYASLSLPDPDQQELMRLYALDYPEGKNLYLEGMVYAMQGSGSGTAFHTRKPFTMRSPFPERMKNSPIVRTAERENLHSFCFLPLIGRDRSIATLNLGRRRDDAFTQEDLYFLNQVAAQVAIAVENALDYRQVTESKERLAEERRYLEDELRTEHNFAEIISYSPSMKRVLKQVETVAPTRSTVLILGETGTGKELIARAIHNLSDRREQPFVKLNCAAIPLGLLESELFGHEKGAFTGAIARKVGRCELAHQGTLFLDEIGDIPLELQPKLLRVLQEQEFERLGGTRTIRVDARLVAATSRDLPKMSAEQQFRSDLYYRLNIFPITLPPLRERRMEVPLLVRHFVDRYAKVMNRHIETIPNEVMEAMTAYPWPGNVRELQNFVERSVILSPGSVLRAPLGELKAPEGEIRGRSGTLEEVEREYILQVLAETRWVIGGPRGAAARLGVKRTSLVYKMQKLGITRPRR